MDTSILLSSFILLFLVTDPLGNLPIFVSLMKAVPKERRLKLIVREISLAFLFLLIFMKFGGTILALMHLSQNSLGIAGGVILFLIALRMVFPHPDGVFGPMSDGEPYIVPIAIPSVAGPSALATALLLGSSKPEFMVSHILALALAMGVSAFTLGFAEVISRVLGERVTTAFERLMGLILTAVAAEMLLSGIREYLKTLK